MREIVVVTFGEKICSEGGGGDSVPSVTGREGSECDRK